MPTNNTRKDSICLSSQSNWTFSKESLHLLFDQPKPESMSQITKSRCLAENKICSGQRSIDFECGDLGIQINATAKYPCIFPFSIKEVDSFDSISKKTYHSCTKKGGYARSWCALSVKDETKEYNLWGWCDQSCKEDNTEEVYNEKGNTTLIVTVSICTLFIVSSICYAKRKKRIEEKDTTMKGDIAMINDQLVLNEQAAHLSYSGDHEMDRSNFEIGRKLGGGNFGSVHEGMAVDIIHPGQMNKVAIKSVNNPLDPAQIYSLICEIKILDQLEKRLDLVNMVGACTTQFKIGKIFKDKFIVTELRKKTFIYLGCGHYNFEV